MSRTTKNIKKYFKELLCRHKYCNTDYIEKLDEYTNTRYSMRKYVCNKCGKVVWVDGRYDYILWKETKKHYKKRI